MNTRVGYHYADKTDCRKYTSVVVAGTITWDQIEPYLVRQNSFIPGQLGLEDLQYRFALPGGDHPWHQITATDLRPTESAPTIAMTAAELAERFAASPWSSDRGVGLARRAPPSEASIAPRAAGTLVETAEPATSADGVSAAVRSLGTRSRKPTTRTK